MSDLKIVCLMLTRGRHYCAERSLSFFLDQDYPNKHLIIYQNSPVEHKLDESIDPSLVTLINNNICSRTGKPYDNLGDVHNDALKYIPEDADVVNIFDDDDARQSYFLSEGVAGYKRAIELGKKAFKPKTCLLRSAEKIEYVQNVLEGSWFINAKYLLEKGFKSGVNVSHHEGWTLPLINNGDFLSDDINLPRYIYNWGENLLVYKTSGAGETWDNFLNYCRFSREYGDQIFSRINVDKYYKEIEDFLSSRAADTLHN